MEDNRPIIASGPDPEPQPTPQPQSVPQPQPNSQSQPATQSQPQPILQSQSIPSVPIDPRSLVKPAKLPDFMLESSSPNPAKNEDGDIILTHGQKKNCKKTFIFIVAFLSLIIFGLTFFFLISSKQPQYDDLNQKILKYGYFIKTGRIEDPSTNFNIMENTAYKEIAESYNQSEREKFAKTAKELHDSFSNDLKKYIDSGMAKNTEPKGGGGNQHRYLQTLNRCYLDFEKNFAAMQEFLRLENIDTEKITKKQYQEYGEFKDYIKSYYLNLSKINNSTVARFLAAKSSKEPEANNILVNGHNADLYLLIKHMLDKDGSNVKK